VRTLRGIASLDILAADTNEDGRIGFDEYLNEILGVGWTLITDDERALELVEGLATEEQKAEFKVAFDLYDKDGSGAITLGELGAAMGIEDQATLQNMIDQVDMVNADTINFAEFTCMMLRKAKDTDIQDEIVDAFKVFDTDGSGFISREELKAVMENLGEAMSADDVEQMITDSDVDGDGRVKYEEFVRMMMSSNATAEPEGEYDEVEEVF